jgi:hypothetical protein
MRFNMTVQELIARLASRPPELPVYVSGDETGWDPSNRQIVSCCLLSLTTAHYQLLISQGPAHTRWKSPFHPTAPQLAISRQPSHFPFLAHEIACLAQGMKRGDHSHGSFHVLLQTPSFP